jgi:hypothetical protein
VSLFGKFGAVDQSVALVQLPLVSDDHVAVVSAAVAWSWNVQARAATDAAKARCLRVRDVFGSRLGREGLSLTIPFRPSFRQVKSMRFSIGCKLILDRDLRAIF